MFPTTTISDLSRIETSLRLPAFSFGGPSVAQTLEPPAAQDRKPPTVERLAENSVPTVERLAEISVQLVEHSVVAQPSTSSSSPPPSTAKRFWAW